METNENCNQHISLYSGKVAKRPRVIASRCAVYLIVMTLIRQMRGQQTPPGFPHFPSVSAQVLSMALPPAVPTFEYQREHFLSRSHKFAVPPSLNFGTTCRVLWKHRALT